MRKIIYDLIYCFINYFVAYIPSWTLRKILYMAFGMKIGRGSRINMRTTIFSPWKIEIGNDTIINEKCVIDGRGGMKIGNHCSISYGACLYSASHDTSSSTFEAYCKRTTLGKGVWICVNAVILPGSDIHDFAIIGANSVFKGQAKEKGVYVGVPAELVKDRKIEAVNMKNNFYFR